MESKSGIMKSILVYVGILLILTGSMAVKNEIVTFFFIGLALLAVQTFGLTGVDRKRLAVAETVLSGAVAVAAVVQLTAARSFGTSQQDLSSRRIAILELWTNHRPTLERNFQYIGEAVEGMAPGQYLELTAPVSFPRNI